MIETFIITYGYLALLIGTFLEGEAVLVIAGILANLGLLNLTLVIVVAFFGSILSDQTYFWIGRKKGNILVPKHPRWQKRLAKVNRLLEKHQVLVMISFRFLYGLRIISPFAIGMSKISTKRFVFFNTLGSALWAVLFGCGGFVFGNALKLYIGDFRHYEFRILLSLIAIALISWLFLLVKDEIVDAMKD